MSKSVIGPVSVPSHVQDLRKLVLRRYKFLRKVEQYSHDESMPICLFSKLFKTIKKAKNLEKLHFKWVYSTSLNIKPGLIKLVFRRHCKAIQNFDISIMTPDVFESIKNLSTPLKNPSCASIYTISDMKSTSALPKIKHLVVQFDENKNHYEPLLKMLRRLQHLETIQFMIEPFSLAQVLQLMNYLTQNKSRDIDFKIMIIGDQQQMNIPTLNRNTLQKVIKFSFESIRSEELLNDILIRLVFGFNQLRSLALHFSDIRTDMIPFLAHLKSLSNLEDLRIKYLETKSKAKAAKVLTNLKFPSCLKYFELNMPLHLKGLITKNKQFLGTGKAKNYVWRSQNIFEDEPAFLPLFESMNDSKNIKTVVLDINLLEEFNPHYTSFFVSLLQRLPDINSFHVNLTDKSKNSAKMKGAACFDLAYFLGACSKMSKIEQIEVLMPNFLFEDSDFEVNFQNGNLKGLAVAVIEDSESSTSTVSFKNINKFIKNLLNNLIETTPNLINLTLDFTEVIDENTLLSRFNLIKKLEKLEGLGLKYQLTKCSKSTIVSVGRILRSLVSLNTMFLKFSQSDEILCEINDYIKHHNHLRDVLVQVNDASWIDNDYFMDKIFH